MEKTMPFLEQTSIHFIYSFSTGSEDLNPLSKSKSVKIVFLAC